MKTKVYMKYIEEFKKDEEQQGYFYAKDELLNKLYGFEDRGEFTIEVLDEMFDLQTRIDKAIEYMEEAIHSDSFTELPSGKFTDIGYCIVAFEDLLNILKGDDKE